MAATIEERRRAVLEVRDALERTVAERTGELEAEIEGLIADRARHEQDLQHYEQTVAAHGY